MNAKERIILSALAAVFSPLVGSLAQSEGSSFLDPGRIGIGARAGDEIEEYRADALIPLWRPGNTIVFLNPRGVFLEDADQEAGLGLIVRRRWEAYPLILGVNAYYDSRWTDAGSRFDQAGGGLELLSRRFDLRGNYYYPLTDQKTLETYEETETLVSGNRQVRTRTVYRGVEEALEGYDLEAGVWLPGFSRVLPMGVFVGYEDFETDHEGPPTEGLRVRLEARPHPNLTLDVEWFEEDALSRSEYFVGVRLNLPLDFRKGFRLDRSGEDSGRIPSFKHRMSDPVQRSFRIRTVQPEPVVVSSQSDERVVSRPREPVCYTDYVLDDQGDLVPIRICE